MAFVQQFEDQFTEASDTELLNHTPDTGVGWTALAGNTDNTKTIVDSATNTLEQNYFSALEYLGFLANKGSSWASDHASEVDGADQCSDFLMAAVRLQGGGTSKATCYAAEYEPGVPRVKLIRIDDGVTNETILDTWAGTVGASDKVRIEAVGTVVTVYVAGTSRISYDTSGDGTILTGGQPGIITRRTKTAPALVAYYGLEDTGTAVPSISDVDGDEVIRHGQNVTITGANFESTQGTGRVVICGTDAIGGGTAVEQTVIGSWGATSIQFTADLDTFDFDTDLYLFVENDTGDSNASGFVIQREPLVSLQLDLIDLAGAAQASLTGLGVHIFHSTTSLTAGTPDQVLTGETTDGSGSLVAQINKGSLNGNTPDPVWVTIYKEDGTALGTFKKLVPVYG